MCCVEDVLFVLDDVLDTSVVEVSWRFGCGMRLVGWAGVRGGNARGRVSVWGVRGPVGGVKWVRGRGVVDVIHAPEGSEGSLRGLY